MFLILFIMHFKREDAQNLKLFLTLLVSADMIAAASRSSAALLHFFLNQHNMKFLSPCVAQHWMTAIGALKSSLSLEFTSSTSSVYYSFTGLKHFVVLFSNLSLQFVFLFYLISIFTKSEFVLCVKMTQ